MPDNRELGKSIQASAVKPEVPTEIPPSVSPGAPLPPEKKRPEDERVSRRGFLKGAFGLAAAVTVEEAVTKGAVTKAVINAFTGRGHGTTQSENQPSSGVKPTPHKSPTTEPTKPPEIEIKPTGAIEWKGKPAPLTFLTEKSYQFNGVNYTFSEVSGILIGVQKNKEGYYMAQIVSQNANHDEIRWNMLLGKNNEIINRADMASPGLPFDPTHPQITGTRQYSQKVKDMVSLLENNLGKQFVFEIPTGPIQRTKIPLLIETSYGQKHVSDNIALMRILQSQNKHFNGLAIGLVIYVPPLSSQ